MFSYRHHFPLEINRDDKKRSLSKGINTLCRRQSSVIHRLQTLPCLSRGHVRQMDPRHRSCKDVSSFMELVINVIPNVKIVYSF
ncbi:hypothetical protein GDO81_017689 [Engystomops pustulosus]|uniref:Uncharacterized protein n=1 Tax=Engystomops pustulosus TaxID=76066 RepID=A0AAV7A7L5_ENGPU|nr:hypothetical protein GDO81_017689 [Engystomops pustulosus]